MRAHSPLDHGVRSREAVHAPLLVLVAVLAGAVLILTASGQIYDTNFQTLWEATALLLGDHPYRDFYEWGLPLQAAVSAVAQVVAGHRLIGEFVVQWIFIIAAMVVSMHLALQVSRSKAASLLTMSLALALLAATPTYHYPKMFFYPLALWLSWRYLDDPGVNRAAVLGLTTAIAFLFRHDHGVYIGVLAVAVFGLARAAVPASRRLRAMLAESGAFTAAAAVVLLPWLAVVHLSEGVPEYVRSRADLYEEWSASGSPYASLLTINPIRTLTGDRSLPPRPAEVSFTWSPRVDAVERVRLEREYGLRRLHEGPDDRGLWRYDVSNIYDPELWGLRSEIENADSAVGFEWERLERLQQPSFVPTRQAAELWLYQVVLLVPILLLISSGLTLLHLRHAGGPWPLDVVRGLAAAVFLTVIQRSLREASYALAVVPLTAGVGAWLLSSRRSPSGGSFWPAARWMLTVGMLLITGLATFAYARGAGIFDLRERARSVAPVFAQLMASPPIDGYLPADTARQYDRQMWDSGAVGRDRLLLRYLHDCTRDGDRILATGSTPYHIHYYTNRSVAGGHVFWHIGWRSDTARQTQLLALLQTQSVPFAYSTHDPVLDDLKRYPLIHEYFSQYYVELDGTRGLVLVDTRRQPTGRFGRIGFPCFR